MKDADSDCQRMEAALQQARRSADLGEVPVGAVLFAGNTLLSQAGNAPITANDPSAHAEILALRRAAVRLGNYRLPGTTLYVTLEPCIMCAGALLHARVDRVVFGATDPKTGALVSRYRLGQDGLLNHRLEIRGGVLEQECGELLRSFFASRRK